jgi:alkaline phosphatase D
MTREPIAIGRRTLLRGATLTSAVTGLALGAGPAGASWASATRSAPALIRSGRPALTHGVQAGDVREAGAVLWSRADRPSRLMAEISRDPDFRRAVTVRGPVVTPRSDLTGEIDLGRLPSGTDLHYRIRAVDLDDHRRSSRAVTGRFRTAPGRGDDVRFIWSADIAGQGWGVNPDLGGFPIADVMNARRADFFLCSGDNVYADGPMVERPAPGSTWRNLVTPAKSKVSETLDDYRGQYQYNLMADNWRTFLAETAQISQWDDHEVLNNWYPGEILDDARYTEKRVDVLSHRAHQAFHEYVPVAKISPDPEGRVYRVVHYGPLLDVFVIDMRTHKDPNTANREPARDGGVLGERQTRWLLHELGRSRATWKVIAADLPIGLVVPDGAAQEGVAQGDPGAPLGRERGLADVLTGIKRLGIRNHIWLTADVHYTAAHHYSPDRASYQDFEPFWEFVSGPLNAGTAPVPNALDATFGPRADFVATAPDATTTPADDFQFFGEVEIDARSKRLTVSLRNTVGRAIYTQSLDPHRR